MSIEGGVLIPIPRKQLTANPSFLPEIQSALDTSKRLYSASINQTQKLLDMAKDPKVLQADLQSLLKGLMNAKQNDVGATVSKLLNQTQSALSSIENPDSIAQGKIQTIKINLGAVGAEASQELKKVTLIGPTKEIEIPGYLDTGAERNLIAPSQVNELDLKPVGSIVLSGIEQGAIPSSIVKLPFRIGSVEFKSDEAAIFPPLERIIPGAKFLIGRPAWHEGNKKGINWEKE
jgi:hypothetical protein